MTEPKVLTIDGLSHYHAKAMGEVDDKISAIGKFFNYRGDVPTDLVERTVQTGEIDANGSFVVNGSETGKYCVEFMRAIAEMTIGGTGVVTADSATFNINGDITAEGGDLDETSPMWGHYCGKSVLPNGVTNENIFEIKPGDCFRWPLESTYNGYLGKKHSTKKEKGLLEKDDLMICVSAVKVRDKEGHTDNVTASNFRGYNTEWLVVSANISEAQLQAQLKSTLEANADVAQYWEEKVYPYDKTNRNGVDYFNIDASGNTTATPVSRKQAFVNYLNNLPAGVAEQYSSILSASNGHLMWLGSESELPSTRTDNVTYCVEKSMPVDADMLENFKTFCGENYGGSDQSAIDNAASSMALVATAMKNVLIDVDASTYNSMDTSTANPYAYYVVKDNDPSHSATELYDRIMSYMRAMGILDKKFSSSKSYRVDDLIVAPDLYLYRCVNALESGSEWSTAQNYFTKTSIIQIVENIQKLFSA